MKRKDFFKTLFGVAAVAVVAPGVLREESDFLGQPDTPVEYFPDEEFNLPQLDTSHLSGDISPWTENRTKVYTQSWSSLYDNPEIWEEWFEKYGKDFSLMDFLKV